MFSNVLCSFADLVPMSSARWIPMLFIPCQILLLSWPSDQNSFPNAMLMGSLSHCVLWIPAYYRWVAVCNLMSRRVGDSSHCLPCMSVPLVCIFKESERAFSQLWKDEASTCTSLLNCLDSCCPTHKNVHRPFSVDRRLTAGPMLVFSAKLQDMPLATVAQSNWYITSSPKCFISYAQIFGL